MVVAVVDDIEDRLLDPGRRPFGPEFIEDQDLGLEDRGEDVRLGQGRVRSEGALDLADEVAEIVEDAGRVLGPDELLDDGHGQVGLPDPAG